MIEDGWQTVLADPAWSFDDRGSRMAPEYAGNGRAYKHYETMKLDEICALPVKLIAAENAWLWLWAPNAFVLDGSASKVAQAWGFKPKQLITWTKIGKEGQPVFGGGHYTRVCTEQLVLCVRGKVKPLSRGVAGAILAPRSKHSRKPDEQYGLIESVSPGPFLEMFARSRHSDQWSVWGNEAPMEETNVELR